MEYCYKEVVTDVVDDIHGEVRSDVDQDTYYEVFGDIGNGVWDTVRNEQIDELRYMYSHHTYYNLFNTGINHE